MRNVTNRKEIYLLETLDIFMKGKILN